MSSHKRLDVIIFGASGFTGKVAVQEIAKLKEEKNITWGIAGRSVAKMRIMLTQISKKIGKDLKDVPLIVAEIGNEKSLGEMASRAKVVVNCVGPYRFYGEAVVKACIANGTHHVDVSGEPQYMESMQLNYNEAAEEKGVYVISGCGFDSVPADLGLLHFIENFQGDVNSVETYIEFTSSENAKGAVINYGTYETAIHSAVNADEMKDLRRKLFPKPLPKFTPKLMARPAVHNSTVIDKWCLPFLGSDRSVMYRSQRYFYEHERTRPVQVQTYVGFPSLFKALVVAFFAGFIAALSKLSFTRNLILRYPEFFSAGYVSREGPSEEMMKTSHFSITFSGEGWTEKKPVDEEHTTPPNKTMITKVSGSDPAYGFTSTALLLCAITILQESDKMLGKGGVMTTAAFAKTSLLKELEARGLKCEVIKEEVVKEEEEDVTENAS